MEGGGRGGSRQIAAHVADVHYANLRCRDAVTSHKVGVLYIPPVNGGSFSNCP